MKILCIDDDEGLLYLMRSALEELSYQVTVCDDGAEALPILQSQHFDAVLLDHEMPKLNGVEFIKRAHTLPNKPPLIMVTGAGSETVAVEAMRLGASDYVVKDVNLGYLKILPVVIQQVVEARELRQRQLAAERAAEAAQQAAQAEQERSRLLGQFIRDASHEFRLPLAVIQTSTELLGRTVTEAKQQTYVKRVLQQTGRILSLVDHLIQLSRLENATMLPLQPIVVQEVVGRVVARKGAKLEEKSLTLQQEIAGEVITAMADPDELADALAELFDNAIIAVQPNRTLTLRVWSDGETAKIALRDEGVGMSDEQRTRIFERFYRVDEAHSTPGFGLGLPVVARIVELHGGTVEVSSALGVGTEVVVTLPRDVSNVPTSP